MGRRRTSTRPDNTHLTGVPGEQHLQQVRGQWYCFCLEQCCLRVVGKVYECLCEECDCEETSEYQAG